MAHTKSAGAAKRNVDVAGKRLGIKKFGGEFVIPGNIILRQRGTKFYPGTNVGMGKDHTLFAKSEGFVHFKQMTGYKRSQKIVHITPENFYAVTETKVVSGNDKSKNVSSSKKQTKPKANKSSSTAKAKTTDKKASSKKAKVKASVSSKTKTSTS